MDHETNEALRKTIHILVGLLAFLLKTVPWRYAAGVAAFFVIVNWLLLHRVVGTRISRHERGYDAGLVLYPAAVFALIVTFNWHIEIAAVSWVLLAFGDGFAGLIGRAMPIAPLWWNREKSWGGILGFILCGGGAAYCAALYFEGPLLEPLIITVLVCAVAESLPLGIDDNVVIPIVAGGMLAVTAIEPYAVGQPAIAWPWLALNTLLAILGFAFRGVDASGALAGWILGTVIVIGGGPALYVALLTFFIIGTLCTKLGYKHKQEAGLAQEGGGRRSAAHAFANCCVAAVCAAACWRGMGLVPLFMGVAALATAAADTTGSEIGQLIGKRAFLPLTFRRVERGTEGAISIEGTLAGIVSAFLVALAATAMLVHQLRRGFTGGVVIDRTHVILVLTACGVVGSYFESILGSWEKKLAQPIPNGTMNFLNTLIGAFLFWVAWHWVPMFGFEF